MSTLLVGLAQALVLALAGELLKSLGQRWFRSKDPSRVDRCPRCRSENLDRGLSSAETAIFMARVLVMSLAVTTMVIAGIIDAFLLLVLVFGHGDVQVALTTTAVVLGAWVVVRLLLPGVLRHRGRAPRQCRSCGYRFPTPPRPPTM